ncbi:hypothetical protein ACFPM0_22910 [Pseudonocardia sulfidoxydans]|uniref:hypothetical protein n=1 Tax=Pseudonocardia sulfidoxydans TaxID=54011 RepID=UPI003621F4C0
MPVPPVPARAPRRRAGHVLSPGAPAPSLTTAVRRSRRGRPIATRPDGLQRARRGSRVLDRQQASASTVTLLL